MPIVCVLSCLLMSCATSRTEIVHVPTPVTPPADLMADCQSQPSDGTIGGELMRLSGLANCERGSKAAIRAWAQRFTEH